MIILYILLGWVRFARKLGGEIVVNLAWKVIDSNMNSIANIHYE